MIRATLLASALVILALPLSARAQIVAPPFYNYGGVIAYTPVIGTVLSGSTMTVRPTVSADMKYVTLSIQPTVSRLISLENFPVVVGAAGFVGGAVPAGPAGAVLPNVNAAAPVFIGAGNGGRVLNRQGMTRIE